MTMPTRLFFLMTMVLTTFCSPVEAAPFDAKIRQFVQKLQQCLPGRKQLRIGVLGFRKDDAALSSSEQTAIRLAVEEAIEKLENISITPTSDLGTILETSHIFRERDLRKLVKNASNMDAIVYFKRIRRGSDGILFRLNGITSQAKCKSVSQKLRYRFSGGINFANINQILKNKASELVRDELEKEDKTHIAILPFSSPDGKYNECERELQERMGNTVSTAGNSGLKRLKGKQVIVSYISSPDELKNPKKTIIVDGTFSCDLKRNKWISIRFRRNRQQVIATLPKTFVKGLKCGCNKQDFFEKIITSANSCPAYFKMKPARKIFYTGEYFDISLSAQQKTHLYCWYLANDKTAYILVPNKAAHGTGILPAYSKKHYPVDFNWPAYRFSEEGEDMFGCFVRNQPLPDTVQQAWMQKWGPEGGKGKDGELVETEIFDLLKKIRRTRGTGECYTPIRIKTLQ